MLFLRSPRIASRVFGLDQPGQVVKAVPRMKFMFYVEFTPSSDAAAMLAGANINGYQGNRSISFKVRQIDKPKINLATVELNQYNKKSIAYSKVEYAEASMRLYDSVDDSVLAMWVDYFTYYFGDSRLKVNRAYTQSPVDPQFVDASGWGLRPLTNNTRFFDKITVYGFYANTYTAFSYINPKITSIDWQNRDYSGNDPEEVGVQFKYEAVEYQEFGKPFEPSQASRFGWQLNDALNTNTLPANRPIAPVPRIFGPQSNNIATPNSVNPANNFVQPLELSELPPALAPGAVPPVVEQSAELSPGLAGGQPVFEETVTVTPVGGERAASAAIASVEVGGGNSAQAQVTSETPAEQTARTLSRNERFLDAAVNAGVVPVDTNDQVTGKIEGGIVTSVTVGERTFDLYENLSPTDQARVNRSREFQSTVRTSRIQSEI